MKWLMPNWQISQQPFGPNISPTDRLAPGHKLSRVIIRPCICSVQIFRRTCAFPARTEDMQRTILLVFCLLLSAVTCWFGMELFHESGHMLAALLSGGKIEHLDFPLLGFSRTDISPNPHPCFVAWGGPFVGSAVPLAAWIALRLAKRNYWPLHLFAACCLIANGAYIGAGSFDRIGDAGDILRYGSPISMLWIFGAFAVGGGIWLIILLRLK